MNFKKLALGSAIAATAVIGTVATSAPAHALSLAPGGFTVNGTGVTGTKVNNNQFTVNLNAGSFTLLNQQGALAGLTGTPILKALTLNKGSSIGGGLSNFSSGSVSQFISGLTLGDRSVYFDLDPAAFIGKFSGNNPNPTFNFGGSSLSGTLFAVGPSGTSTAIGAAAISTLKLSQRVQGTANVQVQTVPTPALLPGLVGLGVAALRKRKGEAAEEIEAANA